MLRPLVARLQRKSWATLAFLSGLAGGIAPAQHAAPGPEIATGQFFSVVEPITQETKERIRGATRQLVDRNATSEAGTRPILVFEFLPGEAAPGTSEFGACYDLANLISKELAGAKLTVAFVPKPLKGYAVLPALACTEIVMGSSASLGPMTPEGQPMDPALREPVRFLAIRKTRDPDLLLGMLDRDADLRVIHTADKAVHYVLPENKAKFVQTHQQVIDEQPAWDAGQRGTLTARRAREEGFCKRTAESRKELANLYHLGGRAAIDDLTLGQEIRPDWIEIRGPLESVTASMLARSIQDARQRKVNLLFIGINSAGGTESVCDRIGDLLSAIRDMKTVAYVDDRATGVAALLPLACRDIVFKKGARIGDVRQSASGRKGALHDLPDVARASLANKAALWARENGHPEALAVAMVNPDAEIVEARDSQTGASRLLLRTQAEADRGRFQVIGPRKEAGSVLTIRAEEAESYGLGQVVQDAEELKGIYGLRNHEIRVHGATWVDSLVTILTEPYVSWLLLFIGGFMLVIELKLPGVGLPAIISAVAFLLFFWSQYLSGTADQLEIILFLVGLVCLALEIFVFPGFGVFGMSGILLMLCSIVLARHTFVWPSTDYEYEELGHTLLQVTGMLAAVGGCVIVLARYFPSMPLFNRFVLKPEPWTVVEAEDSLGRPLLEGSESLAFLIGETGRTTSSLRPTGKARFGNLLIDVTADGAFVEEDNLVEVVDVQGPRVIVKKVGS
jgi:membrane-bound serine protease (ClpP class)